MGRAEHVGNGKNGLGRERLPEEGGGCRDRGRRGKGENEAYSGFESKGKKEKLTIGWAEKDC